MRAALIPPAGLESYALHSKFHLALPLPKLMRNTSYVRTYQRAAASGDFIVLDNGEAEGVRVTTDELLAAAELLAVQEIILPDELRHGPNTIERVGHFIASRSKQVMQYNLMAVAQGIALNEFKACVHFYATHKQITTVGIPRLMLATLNNASARIDFANWIEGKYPGRFKLHLLGADATHRREIKWAAKYANHIRSTDSSMPFNYALQGQMLATSERVVNRPEGFFDRSWTGRVNIAFVKANIETYVGWADGKETPEGELRELSTSRDRKVRPFAAPFNP